MNVFQRIWLERKANVPAFSSVIDIEEENKQEAIEDLNTAISNGSQSNEFWDDVTEDNLPSKIEAQYQNILKIDKAIQEAQENAEKALATAREQVPAKLFHKSDAIDSTQEAVKELAAAQVSFVESQELLFENQQKLANGMKFLFLLGVKNVSMTRLAIHEIKNKLENSDDENLSEYAKDELRRVIKQLHEQEDLFNQQERMINDHAETKQKLRESINTIEQLKTENQSLKQQLSDMKTNISNSEIQHKNELFTISKQFELMKTQLLSTKWKLLYAVLSFGLLATLTLLILHIFEII